MLRRPTAIALAAAGLAGGLLAPAAAHAVTRTTYDVLLEGDFRYALGLDHRESGFRRTTDISAKGVFASSVGQLTFLDGEEETRPDGRSRADLDVVFRPSGSVVETSTSEFGPADVRTCALDDRPLHGAHANGYVEQSLLQPLVPGAPTAMELRIADVISMPVVPSARCPEGSGPAVAGTREAPFGRLDAEFELPREAATAGKTIQLVSGPSHEACPGSESPEAVSCSFDWKGTVTLTKVAEEVLDDDGQPAPTTSTGAPAPAPTTSTGTPAPPPPAPTTPAPPTPTTPATTPSTPLGDLVDRPSPLVPAATAAATADGRRIALRASCPSGCAGTATLRVGARATSRAAGAAAGGARLRFAVPAGPARTVRVRVPARAAGALRRAGRGRLAVTLTPRDGGAPVRRTVAVRVARR